MESCHPETPLVQSKSDGDVGLIEAEPMECDLASQQSKTADIVDVSIIESPNEGKTLEIVENVLEVQDIGEAQSVNEFTEEQKLSKNVSLMDVSDENAEEDTTNKVVEVAGYVVGENVVDCGAKITAEAVEGTLNETVHVTIAEESIASKIRTGIAQENASDIMEVQEEGEKDKEANYDSVLVDENSRSDMESSPIEEIDPICKDDSNDGSPDPGDADPLMKDAEMQAEGDEFADESTGNLDEKPEDASDRIMLTVKPPGELLESTFVDVADDNSIPEDGAMDFDPIKTENEDNVPAADDIFNDKEAETILAEDDAEASASAEDEAQSQEPEVEAEPVEDENKFIITAANRAEKSTCNICDNEEVPQYLAHKNDECECICSTTCLNKFKEQHVDNYVERILRLRIFATEEPTPREQMEFPVLLEEDDGDEERDPFRKCINCKQSIDVNDYVTWEAQDYCGEACLTGAQKGINNNCAKCEQAVPFCLLGKYCVRFGTTVTQFCKTSCLISYKKAHKLCQFCQEDLKGNETVVYCSKRCKDAANPAETDPKESALCSVCRQVKEVELNVRADITVDSICSERCLVAYKFVNKVELVKCVICPTSFSRKPGDPSVYDLGTVHILCSKECQKIFLITHRKIVNCNMCMVKKYDFDMIRFVEGGFATCVCSIACLNVYFECMYTHKAKLFEPHVEHLESICNGNNYTFQGKDISKLIDECNNFGKMAIQVVMVTKPRAVPKQKNKALMCQPRMLTKAIQHKVKERSVNTQTEDTTTRWIPIPVPIFVPMPMHMYVQPVPMPTPIPIPLIIPIFILTGRRSMKGIRKEIAKIKNRIPADPLEAEILMMADMAAGDKRNEPTSDSDEDTGIGASISSQDSSKMMDTSMSQIDSASTSFSDDVLSMAFKMANEYTEPLDLESEVDNSSRMLAAGRRPRIYAPRGRSSQRIMEIVKPDEGLSLKYTFGVNAWKQWASIKNLELQKQKSPKFVKLDLLQFSAEDLCFCLCQFVKEVRKPNGTPYASDTIYYLCLGIQLYLYENGRIDNLFCDAYYEKFTDAFNDICLSFCQLYNESQYIVTRVEEEHLWESKQLGAHSPLVLLNTLLFFNTKHFNLTTVDDHLQLSFSHIMKHWKRNANAPNQRNVLLRFYPPSKGAWGKRKVYEQQECLENPLRCPVRLYEFFLSKCPESVKTRNDVFYLQPERSCVPDSPVWYSTTALERAHLGKMLNRMKMIKEISMAILGT